MWMSGAFLPFLGIAVARYGVILSGGGSVHRGDNGDFGWWRRMEPSGLVIVAPVFGVGDLVSLSGEIVGCH